MSNSVRVEDLRQAYRIEEMIIRPAEPADATQAIPLIVEAIGGLSLALTGTESLEAASPILEDWFRREENRHSYRNTLVAEENEILIGVVVAYDGELAPSLDLPLEREAKIRSGNTEYRIDTEADPHEFYLDTISVASPFRGRGIAKKLIEGAEKLARQSGQDRMGLIVEPENERACRFYRKQAFVDIGQKKIAGRIYRHWIRRLDSGKGSTTSAPIPSAIRT